MLHSVGCQQTSSLAWAAIMVAATLAPAAGPGATLQKIDGTKIDVEGLRFDADNRIHAVSGEGSVDLPATDLLSIEVHPVDSRPSRQPALLLPGDEVLHGELVSVGEEEIELKNDLFGTANIPLSAVEGFLLGERVSGQAKDQLIERIRSLPRTADAILLVNGDVLEGTITTFGPDEWAIDLNGRDQPVESALLRGVALDKNLVEYKPTSDFHARVTLTDGSVIAAKSLRVEGDECDIEMVAGPTLRVSWSGGIGPAIVRVDYRNGRVLYLSDATPMETEVVPFLDDRVDPKSDANANGRPLRLAGQRYEKGIGMRSATRMDFDAEGFSRFLATIGIDDSAGDEASVEFLVFLDGQPAFRSQEMTTRSEPQTIDLPLGDAQVVSLEVNYAKRGDVQDLADWCDARLVKPAEE